MNDRRPTTPERGQLLDEGETLDDQMEEFPTSELTMAELEELKAATGLEQFKIGKMFESGRQRQQDTAKLWNELQRIEKEGPAAAQAKQRDIQIKEMMADMAEEANQRNQTNPMYMSSSLRETSDPFKFLKDLQTVQTDAQLRNADQPRDLLRALLHKKLFDKGLLRPKESGEPTRFGDLNRGGRRRSKKSDTKKYKTRSKSRSRISTKRKNKNRRQTRK
jgi:hypothetical protein